MLFASRFILSEKGYLRKNCRKVLNFIHQRLVKLGKVDARKD